MGIVNGDYGTVLQVSTGIDLTDATGTQIKITFPDNTVNSYSATIQNPATDGILLYTSVQYDFVQLGTYKIIADITFGGAHFSGQVDTFDVQDVFV